MNLNEDDKLCWMEAKDGLYTIRSNYCVIKEWEKYQYEGTSDDINNYNSRWVKLWKKHV